MTSKLRCITPKAFSALDAHLMSPQGAYTLDQLMELAGLSVSQAIYTLHPPPARVLIACGPGNNGGDGLVAARHLALYGYDATVWYPKPGRHEHLGRLDAQLRNMHAAFVERGARLGDLLSSSGTRETGETAAEGYDVVVDAVFGASFQTGPVREPFPEAIEALATYKGLVLAVDAPSGWDIESGPPGVDEKDNPAKGYMPAALISLTAPKPLVREYKGRHFVGGRFLTKQVAEEFGIDVPDYPAMSQIVEVPVDQVQFD